MRLESLFVIARSVDGARETVSVAELLAGVVSVKPVGALTLAVLTRVPVATALIVPVTVYVSIAPAGTFAVSLILPVPLAEHEAPPVVAHVHVTELSEAGMVSAMVAPTAFEGPLLAAVTVYVTTVPGTADAAPSVFVIVRSPVGFSVSLSEAELFVAVGSTRPDGGAIDAVLATLPVALGSTVAVSVYVAVAPEGRVTVSLIEPEPEDVQVAPPAPTQVQVAFVSSLDRASVTVAPVAVDGPELDATIV